MSLKRVRTILVLAAAFVPGPVQAHDEPRSWPMKFENHSSYAITHIWVTWVSRLPWEAFDVIKADPLPPGGEVTGDIPEDEPAAGEDPCVVTIEVVFADGDKAFNRQFNICKTPLYRLTD